MPKSIIGLQGCPQRMDPGALGTLVKKFTSQLLELGYSPITVTGYEDSARHFGQWLQRKEIAVADIDEDVVRRVADALSARWFARHRCRCPGARKHSRLSGKYVKRAQRFISFLVDRGAVAPPVPDVSMPRDDQVVAYQEWLRQHRGLCERTINGHGRMIMRLLPALGNDPEAYDASLVRSVILAEAKCASRAYVKKMTTALRGYLRFLAARGACRPGLDQAIPTIPQWRLSTLPLYLPENDVDLVIASCDLTKTHGVRNRAILLLLARLGLRAGDILDMRVDDVSWAEGTLRETKFHKSRLLPLHDTVRRALEAYLSKRMGLGTLDGALLVSNTGGSPAYSTVVIVLRAFSTRRAPRVFNTSCSARFQHDVFLQLARSIGLRGEPGQRGPRIHDLRHTFAVRSLEQCGHDQDAVRRHIVGLSTYLGHAHVTDTYWYLQATPVLKRQIAEAGEALHRGGAA